MISNFFTELEIFILLIKGKEISFPSDATLSKIINRRLHCQSRQSHLEHEWTTFSREDKQFFSFVNSKSFKISPVHDHDARAQLVVQMKFQNVQACNGRDVSAKGALSRRANGGWRNKIFHREKRASVYRLDLFRNAAPWTVTNTPLPAVIFD